MEKAPLSFGSVAADSKFPESVPACGPAAALSVAGTFSFVDNLVVVIGILKRMPKGSRLKRLSGSVLPRLEVSHVGFPRVAASKRAR